jgi:5'-nucleotidase
MTEKKVVYIDLDGVIVDLIGQMNIELSETSKKYNDPTDIIDDSETIFINAKPIPQALESIAELEKYYDVFILSTAPWHNIHSWSQKRMWVEKYLPSMFKKLILTHHKEQLIGDYLIDDRKKNGASEFKGKHIHIFSEHYPTWQSVLDELINKKFQNIPDDNGTYVLSNIQTKFGELDCVYQVWVYDLIQGSSLIFYNDDIKDLSNEDLENLLRSSSLMTDNTSEITFSKENDKYTFVNFNFEVLD